MGIIQVNKDKCIKCGACADVCPKYVIEIGTNGPQEKTPNTCVQCGHCVAVCPTSAIDNQYAPLDKQVYIKNNHSFDEKNVYEFIRSRRSTRCYKQDRVPKDTILKLLDIARFAPTGGNSQGISYLVISDKEKLKQISEITITWMEQQIASNHSYSFYSEIIDAFRKNGKDTILRDAPNLILALSPKDFGSTGYVNARYTLTYAELFAPTLRLGTCWAGLLENCMFSQYMPLLKVLDIPKNKMVVGAIMMGYPKYSYKRLVDRDSLEISFR